MKKILLVVFSILLVLIIQQNSYAQGVTTASMTGFIQDDKGEGLPGANVVAIHVPSGTQYGTSTQVNGRYNIPGMRTGGPYKVTVSFVGYKEQSKENIYLALGVASEVSFTMLEDGKELAEVVVTAERNSAFGADRTGAATNIANEQINRLPTISRSFADFTRLTPQAASGGFAGRGSRFNNITVDGALFNNAFGLSGTVGGQTSAQPISLDAVEEIQVNIAPYDVRQGAFTGGGVNAVTRSGTNEFSGSIFNYSRNESFLGTKVRDVTVTNQPLDVRQTGFRLGGPIIKNKLFFFVNGEQERNSRPATNLIASRPGLSGTNISQASASDLDALSSFLRERYNYNTGPYENFNLRTNSDKILVRLDWNISDKHKFSLKYNYLKSFADINPSNSGALPNGRNPSNTNMPFFASYYIINNNLNSFIAELNSRFSNNVSNTFIAGYSAFRDFRESPGGIFPLVDIGNGSGQAFTAFGYEPFSANNLLNTDVYQISDNLSIFKGKHVITLGTYNEFYKFTNGFAPAFFGRYQFSSLQSFYDNVNGVAGANPTQYEIRYSAVPGVEFPFAKFSALQLGFFAQDQYTVSDKFNVTFGLRADIPIILPENLTQNTDLNNRTFRDGTRIDVSKVQKTTALWSPRVGFNWDVFGNQKTQVRGGTGIFTGRVPYVWISNQISNTGNLFGSIFVTNPAQLGQFRFNPDVNAYRPSGAASPNYNIAYTQENFKFPQVWRTNIGVDQQLPWGIVGTLDIMYTKDLNAVYFQNVNLPNSTINANGADNRPIFFTRNAAGNLVATNRINSNISDAILLANTRLGYSFNTTVQLKKTFGKDLFAMVAYSYTDAQSVSDGGSIAQSSWRDRFVSGDPNANVLANADALVPHRFITSISYRKEYLKSMATTISIFLEAASGRNFSYTYAGDMNGDGSGGGGNDLMYIPRNQNEIRLLDITGAAAGGTGQIYTAAQQWADLDRFINQDKYLSGRRGQYAERNGSYTPGVTKMDLSIKQDFFINIAGKRNTIQLSFDIFNFTNLLNKNWGIERFAVRSAPLSFAGYAADATPQFRFNYLNSANRVPLTESFQDGVGLGSRWVAQFGIRYIFN
jgi:hypothetical protein